MRSRDRSVKSSYDSAQTTSENQNHWAAADSYSANAALDAGTRQTLRDRSRYEEQNNGYYSGLAQSIANDVVGTAPRVQITIPGDVDRKFSRFLERRWLRWIKASNCAEDLRLMHRSTVVAGETFAIITSNPAITQDGRNLVELDLQLYEPEQVSDPWDFGTDPLYSDGVRYDLLGNPVEYSFLVHHPGGVSPYRSFETQIYPASQVIHWYKPVRPGQHRGVPWLVSALPLFAQLRRYTLATLSAAEIAAMLAGIMKTNFLPDTGAPMSVDTFETIDLVRGALLTLPPGWEAQQFEAKQPISTYRDFKRELLNEIARPAQVPFNVIAGNSSGYNYSSAKLDHQLYHRSIWIERHRMESKILDRIFWQWLREATLAYELLRQAPGIDSIEEWEWSWFWDGFASIEPQKEAAATKIRLETGVISLPEVCAEEGRDWEEVIRQQAAVKSLQKEIASAREQHQKQK